MSQDQEKALTVAIVVEEMAQARAMALSFRKLGIVPYYYETLREYWDDIFLKEESEYPDFNIVDVKMMSDGKLFLSAHPAVKNGELCLAFYYNEQSRPLIHSTYDIFNFGEIRKANNYDGQLKTILKRVNSFQSLTIKRSKAEKEVSFLRQQNAKMVGQIGDLRERRDFQDIMTHLVQNLDESLMVNDFNYAIMETISNWQGASAMALYELNQNGQRLMSANYQFDKLQELPSLWLGQVCSKGVESFAENMATQVAFDLMGDSVVVVKICGIHALPDMLAYIKVDADYFHGIDWDLLGRFASSSYRAFLMNRESTRSLELTGENIGLWDLVDSMDQDFNELKNSTEGVSDQVVINLDFGSIMSVLRDNNYLRFHWSDFHKDFLYQIKRNSTDAYRVCFWGTEHMSFVLSRADSESFNNILKDLNQRFAFWRYFEDSTFIMNVELAPKVTSTPFSPTAFLRYIEKSNYRRETTISRKAEKARSVTGPKRPDMTM